MGIVTNDMLLIKVNEDGSTIYPVTIKTLNEVILNTCLPDTPEEELLAEYKVYVVQQVPKPEGDVITEGQPVFIDDTWRQTWLSRPYTPEEVANILGAAKVTKLFDINKWYAEKIAIGFPYKAPDNETYHVQMRDADRVNILGRYTKAKEALVEETSTLFVFRFYENVSLDLTAEQMVGMCNQSEVQAVAGYGKLWALKDQTRAATTLAELPEIPEELYELILTPGPA